jgi:alpha-tubulin suppressor-like RCC1 family protein
LKYAARFVYIGRIVYLNFISLSMRFPPAVARLRIILVPVSVGGGFAFTALRVEALAPTGIGLSAHVVTENAPNGTIIGILTAVDADAGDSHTFTFVTDVGPTENSGFSISGNQLRLDYKASGPDGEFLDFEKRPNYSIRVRATDFTGEFCDMIFEVVMLDDRTEDADHDGLSEATEEDSHGTSDVRFDTDGDGFGDPLEILKNSSPTDSSAWPDYPLIGWGDNQASELLAPDASGIAMISTGQDHNLGLKIDGSVTAWAGFNEYGQNTIPAGLATVVAIAAGGDYWWQDSAHSLVLKADASVAAWGYDDEGMLTPPPGLGNVVAIAAGRAHSMALKRDGTVVTWGRNLQGQCSSPPGLAAVVAIAAGGFYSLALKSNGSVVAWGSNFNGVSWERATVPAGLSDVVAVSAGRFHSMALKSDGTVVSWGYNLDGQTNVPADLSDVVAVSAGGFHSLALKSDGSVVGWGANANGQVTIPSAAHSQVRAISAGLLHSLALRQAAGFPKITSSTRISAAPGQPLAHQISVANALPSHFTALGLPAELTLDPLTGLISGTVTSAVRRSVQIQVETNLGKLTQVIWIHVFQGLPATAINLSPAAVMENSPADSVVGSLAAADPDPVDQHTFELVDGSGAQDNGRFRVSGNQLLVNERLDRDYEQNSGTFSIRVRARDASLNPYETVIVLPFLDDRQEDVDGDGLSEAVEEDLVGTSDLAYDTDGDGFGDGFERARGTSPTSATHFPTGQILESWGRADKGQTTLPSGLGEIIGLAGGWGHSLALNRAGTVTAWGWNDDGQCTPPTGMSNAVAIAAGGYHSLALRNDGTLLAWGGNNDGQSTVPTNLSGVVAIAAGNSHNLALMGDGTVVAWGNNENGQATVPPGLSGVIAIAAGGYHSLALKSDGSVVAWGADWTGAATVPAGLERVIAIAAGGFHSLALKNDGTVMAWGNNEVGQRNVPQSLGNVIAIKAGWLHGMALKQDGTLVSWGSNADGQAVIPIEARYVHLIDAGGFHNLVLRQATGFPEIASSAAVVGWPGQTLTHQVVVNGATPSHFSAMGLPAGLTINPTTGMISGSVVSGQRRSVRITADTDKGRLNQVLWFNTADGRPPTAIMLSGTPLSLLERSPTGTVVGTLSALDPDLGDFHTFNLTVIAGSPDPYCLTTSGNQVVLASAAAIDFENGTGSLTIRVRASDSTLNSHEQDFTIQLIDDRTEDADGDGASEAMEEDLLFTSDLISYDFNTSDGDHDGIPALIEYACNLNLQTPDAGSYLGDAGSISGLPLIRPIMDAQRQNRLRMEYLRRIGSGLTYLPEFSSGLNPENWAPATNAVKVTPINAQWERCVIDDAEVQPGSAVRFGRLGISP